MAKIAFILLCHKDPEAVVAQARRLTAMGDYVSIHYDARAGRADFDRVFAALDANDNVVFADARVKCGWGEWSLVAATLAAVRAALEAFPDASHLYMLSGDCMPIKTAEYAHEFLDAEDVDYIESFDFFDGDWIKTGMKGDRLLYRHFVNERKHKRLFYAALETQRFLGLKRKIPADVQVMIGSQWWCLRRTTVEAILAFIAKRADIVRFFRRTWIPDETFFQTLVPHLIPATEIRTRTLTFLMFTDYGMPVTFYDDHYDLLLSQDFLFARKISPGATTLRARLGDLFATTGMTFQVSNEGRSLFAFLTGRGRVGRRFAPRFWEAEATLGHNRELMMVVCKKWHIAKRLIGRIRGVTGQTCLDYLFNEQDADLPDLGGIQHTVAKRHRHRRAMMRMLYDYYQTDRLVICLDTGNLDLITDFASDRSTVRILDIQCTYSDDYLTGHAMRVGLAGASTTPEALAALVPTLRADFAFESDRIGEAELDGLYRLRESASVEENAQALARFLDIPENRAREIADDGDLFAD